MKARPDVDSQTVGVLYEDAVVPWLSEQVGKNIYRTNQRWIESSDGCIWSPYLQQVHNLPNSPIKDLQQTSLGNGMWVEVRVPYVDLVIDNPPARSPGYQDRLKLGLPLRLYYSQVVWVDMIKAGEQDQVWHRINEKYGSYGDILWGAAQAFRPLTADEMAPVSPDVEEKQVVVNITFQTLSCYEGKKTKCISRVSLPGFIQLSGGKGRCFGYTDREIPNLAQADLATYEWRLATTSSSLSVALTGSRSISPRPRARLPRLRAGR